MEELVQQEAPGVEIGRRARDRAVDPLGRAVLEGAAASAGPGEAEVHDPHLAGEIRDHVGRLQIAVDHPGLVAGGEGVRDGAGDPQRVGLGERALRDPLGERPAGGALHHDVGEGQGAAAEQSDDPGVGDAGQGPQLVAGGRGEDLHHRAVPGGVGRLPRRPEGAAAEPSLEPPGSDGEDRRSLGAGRRDGHVDLHRSPRASREGG